MKKTLLCAALGVAALLGTSRSVNAQTLGRWCATDEHNAELERTYHNPQLAAERRAADALAERLQQDDVFARQFAAQHRTTSASRIVPVVVHVVTKCGNTTLLKTGIESGMAQLNADWQRLNADTIYTRAPFQPYAADLDIEFRLAKLDLQGNSFDGIHRVTDVATDAVNPRDLIKTVVPSWTGYFNIWIVDAISAGSGSPGGIILGYAQFPGTGPWTSWGLVMRYDDWTANPISNGRTAAHEMGHCFNLRHSFTDGGGCGTGCTSSGDLVCDTPPSASSYEPCFRNSPRNTCANDVSAGSPYTTNVFDQDENYMSYNNCQNMFTRGQKARVDAAIATYPYLTNLISPANLLRTGVADGQVVPAAPPVAYLNSCQLSRQGDEIVACVGRNVLFTDASHGADVTGVNWTFSNATPATSTDPNPTVVFSTPGLQTVTLTATGPTGTSAVLTIPVRVLPAGQVTPLTESFESNQLLTSGVWRTETSSYTNPNTWRQVALVTPAVTTEGDTAIRAALGGVPAGTKLTLYSAALDTRNLANSNPIPTLQYDIAYSRRSTTSADELRVSFSNDCGRTWIIRRTQAGAALSTNGTTLATNFIPNALTQWRTESIALTGPFFNQANMMVRFEATSAASGNNLYLDNIRLGGRPLGITEALAAAGVSLAPNPLTVETGLRFSLERATRVGVAVRDVLGRPVLTDATRTYVPGNHELPLAARLQGAAPGVYVVTLELDGRVYSQKLLIQ